MMPHSTSYCLRGLLENGEHRFVITQGENMIGRSADNGLVLPLPQVSRHHARLRCEARGMVLEDLGSRYGTSVNGRRVSRHALRPGDLLRFGAAVELRLEEIDTEDTKLALVLEEPQARPWPAEDSTGKIQRPSLAELLADEPLELRFPEGYLPGSSAAMGRLYRSMRPLLGARLPVLIQGETGVGKELVARTLHGSTTSRTGPFVAINCAAIPTELLEAELFGIGEGVATGVRKRSGKILEAHRGTLFLDELGEMPPELQAKMLRVLDEREVHPVGGGVVPVDVWVLAATNARLHRRAAKGRFRLDLYHRIAGSLLEVPPLRERGEDIQALIKHFLLRVSAEERKVIRGLTVKAERVLTGYRWPGNVRELEHEARRLGYLCADGQVVESKMISRQILDARVGETFVDAPPDPTSLRLADHVQETELRVIRLALEGAGGSRRGAARLLGIARSTLARKLKDLGIAQPRIMAP